MPIRIQNRQRAVRLDTQALKKRLGQVLTALDCADQELSLVFTNNAAMQALNRTYRQRDYATNVLAFPQLPTSAQEPTGLLGDVVVALSVAAREADELGQPLEDWVLYLIVHGILHLLGYDHEGSAAQRRRMEKREREILASLQLPSVL